MHSMLVRQCVLFLLLVLFCTVLIGADKVYADIILSDNFIPSDRFIPRDDSFEDPEGGPNIQAVTNQDEPIEFYGFFSSRGNPIKVVNRFEGDNSYDDGKEIFNDGDGDSLFVKLRNIDVYQYETVTYIITGRDITRDDYKRHYNSPYYDYPGSQIRFTDISNGSTIPTPGSLLVIGIWVISIFGRKRLRSHS